MRCRDDDLEPGEFIPVKSTLPSARMFASIPFRSRNALPWIVVQPVNLAMLFGERSMGTPGNRKAGTSGR